MRKRIATLLAVIMVLVLVLASCDNIPTVTFVAQNEAGEIKEMPFDANFQVPKFTNGNKVFGGWYTDEACSDGNKWKKPETLTDSVTVYAKWTNPLPPAKDPIADNYRVFYQIFVGSFSDSNGDGVGDIRGIINRMDYLNDGNINSGKSLGVQGLWLSPIFYSPSYHKYDARDYYKIDPKFGTEEDLAELLRICHERNVKVILDLAINHTSNLNNWFVQFRQARKNYDSTSQYYDFYTCVSQNNMVSGRTYYPVPGASSWYFEGNFSNSMPELNYDNLTVREEMVKVAKHWLDLGVDGFRFDAIKYIYFNDIDSNVSFWDWYMAELRKIKSDIYVVGECWSADNEILQYYSALNCFSFDSSQAEGKIASAVRSDNINTFTNYVESFLTSMQEQNANGMYCPFIANHDMDRAAGFLTVASKDAYMAANIYLLCSGSPFIYYGEEIGLKGTRGGANSDANRRLAMLWGDNDTVKDPSEATYDASKQTNGTVAEQLEDEDSLLNYYAKVIALRNKYPEIARGSYTSLSCSESIVGGFKIEHNGSVIGLFHNVGDSAVTISLPSGCNFTLLCDYIGQGEAKLSDGKLTIGANTSVILK